MPEFHAWPKIPRLNRNCLATEKIDGTNAAVLIEEVAAYADKHEFELARVDLSREPDTPALAVFAQSRKRLLQTNEVGKGSDNFGFAAWVKENALELAAVLGEGRHFGEWWGEGIQRAYGLDHKRFSLFNAGRWFDQEGHGIGNTQCPNCCYVVPVLASGNRISDVADAATTTLLLEGSHAAQGFDDPEGIVVYHTAARSSFKVTLEADEVAKGTFKGMHSEGVAPAVEAVA